MHRFLCKFLGFLAILVSAGAAAADPPRPVPMVGDWLSSFVADDFVAARRAARARVAAAEEGGARAAATEDLAAFLAVHGLLREADAVLPPDPSERGRALAAIVAVGLGRETGSDQAATESADARAIVRIVRPDADAATERTALRAIRRLPPHLRRPVAERILDAFVAAGRTDVARALLSFAGRDRSAFLAALIDPQLEFDPYGRPPHFLPAPPRSVSDHKNRLKRVDDGIRAGTIDPSSALEVLRQMRATWRGSDDVEVLRRIEALALRVDRPLLAIRAATAALARGGERTQISPRIVQIAERFYGRGGVGGPDLESLVGGHAAILRRARFVPGYHVAWGRYITVVQGMGAMGEAAREERDRMATWAVGVDVGLWSDDAGGAGTAAERMDGSTQSEAPSKDGASPLAAAHLDAALDRASAAIDEIRLESER